MKLNVITRHAVANYGSILQTYATQRIIEELGHECEIINYVNVEERGKNIAKTLCGNSTKWNKNVITRMIYYILQTPNYLLSYNKFKKYRKEILKESQEFSSLEELKKSLPEADVYCSGSDQLWGKIGTKQYDKAYFLDFVPEDKKCIAYASSFGKDEISENLKKDLNKLLSKYETVLVREKSAVDIINANTEKKSELVLDPTLLLDSKKWDEIANVNLKYKDYILVYQLHDNSEFIKYAKKFAKIKKLKLLRICPSMQNLLRGGKPVFLPTPQEFVAYFKNAKYVLTDSFHGTVFSIIFGKKFIDILPKETSTRITNILELAEANNRILKDYNDFDIIDSEMDYELTYSKLSKKRNESIKLLKNAIEK